MRISQAQTVRRNTICPIYLYPIYPFSAPLTFSLSKTKLLPTHIVVHAYICMAERLHFFLLFSFICTSNLRASTFTLHVCS